MTWCDTGAQSMNHLSASADRPKHPEARPKDAEKETNVVTIHYSYRELHELPR